MTLFNNGSYHNLLNLLNAWEQKSIQQGVVVGSIHASAPDFVYHGQDYFIPASCQKIITGLIAIKELGHDFHYVTTLQSESDSFETEVNYRLIFRGDPTLTSSDIFNLLIPLKGKKVMGSLIIDHSYFQTPQWSPHWMEEDIGSDYASPMLAAIIDRNAYECVIYLEKEGRSPYIIGLEKVPYHCKIAKASIPKSTVKVLWKPDKVNVEACFSEADQEMQITISHPSAIVILTQRLQKILNELNIIFEKGIKFHSQPGYFNHHVGSVISEHSSPSLEHFLPSAMKRSDNLIFDTIYLTMLHHYNFTNWSKGSDLFRLLIFKHLGIDFQGNCMVDGSGLSRNNQIKPQLLWSVLKKGFDEPLFMASLPFVMEKETTLEHRSELPLSLKAKTGSMTGINALCGYGGLPEDPYIFVILQDNPNFTTLDFYQVQRVICEKIITA